MRAAATVDQGVPSVAFQADFKLNRLAKPRFLSHLGLTSTLRESHSLSKPIPLAHGCSSAWCSLRSADFSPPDW